MISPKFPTPPMISAAISVKILRVAGSVRSVRMVSMATPWRARVHRASASWRVQRRLGVTSEVGVGAGGPCGATSVTNVT